MALRCVYTDLDGTLLGKYGALFRDADGEFSMRQARALQACNRAGVEVVIMSGRREAQVASDARLMGQTSYIYEAGCGVVIGEERTYLTGDWQPGPDGTPAERMIEAGIPTSSSRPSPASSSITGPGTPIAISPTCSGVRWMWTGRMSCSSRTGTPTCAFSTTA